MGKTAKGKNHPTAVYKNYDGGKRGNQFCPKCGMGVYLAQHKDRMHCGKCGYTEFKR